MNTHSKLMRRKHFCVANFRHDPFADECLVVNWPKLDYTNFERYEFVSAVIITTKVNEIIVVYIFIKALFV